MQTTLLPALLGLGLASSTGLNTFLPLLMLAVAARFGFHGIAVNSAFHWLTTDAALIGLGVATLAEIVGDKVPVVDHALDVCGTVARPVAGAIAAGSVWQHTDPTTAALAGLIIGAPFALGFHAAKAGTRAASSATTLGLGNPVLSVVEDIVAAALSLIAILFPWVVPVFVLLLAFVFYRAWKAVRGILGHGKNLGRT